MAHAGWCRECPDQTAGRKQAGGARQGFCCRAGQGAARRSGCLDGAHSDTGRRWQRHMRAKPPRSSSNGGVHGRTCRASVSSGAITLGSSKASRPPCKPPGRRSPCCSSQRSPWARPGPPRARVRAFQCAQPAPTSPALAQSRGGCRPPGHRQTPTRVSGTTAPPASPPAGPPIRPAAAAAAAAERPNPAHSTALNGRPPIQQATQPHAQCRPAVGAAAPGSVHAVCSAGRPRQQWQRQQQRSCSQPQQQWHAGDTRGVCGCRPLPRHTPFSAQAAPWRLQAGAHRGT